MPAIMTAMRIITADIETRKIRADFRLANFRLNWFRAVQTASRHIDSNRLFLQQGNCLGQGTGGYCGHRTILWPGGGRGRLVVHKKSAKNSAGVEKGLEEFLEYLAVVRFYFVVDRRQPGPDLAFGRFGTFGSEVRLDRALHSGNPRLDYLDPGLHRLSAGARGTGNGRRNDAGGGICFDADDGRGSDRADGSPVL